MLLSRDLVKLPCQDLNLLLPAPSSRPPREVTAATSPLFYTGGRGTEVTGFPATELGLDPSQCGARLYSELDWFFLKAKPLGDMGRRLVVAEVCGGRQDAGNGLDVLGQR